MGSIGHGWLHTCHHDLHAGYHPLTIIISHINHHESSHSHYYPIIGHIISLSWLVNHPLNHQPCWLQRHGPPWCPFASPQQALGHHQQSLSRTHETLARQLASAREIGSLIDRQEGRCTSSWRIPGLPVIWQDLAMGWPSILSRDNNQQDYWI